MPTYEHEATTCRQCFGLDPDSISSVDPYPDPDPGEQKLPTKIEKFKNFIF
jgi:hypothetical protein